MPRKKRNRRQRKNKQKLNEENKIECENTPINVCTPSPQANNKKDEEDASVKSTPVTHRRNLSRKQRAYNGSFNVTNLNILFDSSYIYNTPKSCTNVYVQRNHIAPTISPVLIRNITPKIIINTPVNSAKYKSNDLELTTPQNCDIKTPKLNRVSFLDDNIPNNRKVNNLSNKINNFGASEVNVNPYLNKDNIKQCTKDGTLSELSFFSPQLFNLKSSSTPIDKLSKIPSREFVKEDNNISTKTIDPCNITQQSSSLDSSMDKTPPSVAFERASKSNIFNNTLKRPSTPMCNKSTSVSYVRLSNRSGNGSIHKKTSSYERIFTRLKRYARLWSFHLVEICTQIGVTLVSKISTPKNHEPTTTTATESVCKCAEYREEITNLNTKIEELNNNLETVKIQLEEQKNDKEIIKQLTSDVVYIKKELNQFAELRNELEMLKKCKTVAATAAAPPPPPPPPPPLPAPIQPKNTLIIAKKSQPKTGTTTAARPVISLDDILRVKLKKPTCRSPFTTPLRRIENQSPAVDLLSQVKLKPAGRPSIRPKTPDGQKANITTSPYSSLSRLLTDNNSVRKVKRLQKVGGYSLDSLYRCSPLMSNRERGSS